MEDIKKESNGTSRDEKHNILNLGKNIFLTGLAQVSCWPLALQDLSKTTLSPLNFLWTQAGSGMTPS